MVGMKQCAAGAEPSIGDGRSGGVWDGEHLEGRGMPAAGAGKHAGAQGRPAVCPRQARAREPRGCGTEYGSGRFMSMTSPSLLRRPRTVSPS